MVQGSWVGNPLPVSFFFSSVFRSALPPLWPHQLGWVFHRQWSLFFSSLFSFVFPSCWCVLTSRWRDLGICIIIIIIIICNFLLPFTHFLVSNFHSLNLSIFFLSLILRSSSTYFFLLSSIFYLYFLYWKSIFLYSYSNTAFYHRLIISPNSSSFFSYSSSLLNVSPFLTKRLVILTK